MPRSRTDWRDPVRRPRVGGRGTRVRGRRTDRDDGGSARRVSRLFPRQTGGGPPERDGTGWPLAAREYGKARIRDLERAAVARGRRRDPRRLLGPRPPRARRLAPLERELHADARGRLARAMAATRSGVRDAGSIGYGVAAPRRGDDSRHRARPRTLRRSTGEGRRPVPRRESVRRSPAA